MIDLEVSLCMFSQYPGTTWVRWSTCSFPKVQLRQLLFKAVSTLFRNLSAFSQNVECACSFFSKDAVSQHSFINSNLPFANSWLLILPPLSLRHPPGYLRLDNINRAGMVTKMGEPKAVIIPNAVSFGGSLGNKYQLQNEESYFYAITRRKTSTFRNATWNTTGFTFNQGWFRQILVTQGLLFIQVQQTLQ